MKIPGYTLHGDYYLADKVITDTNWEEAVKMKEKIVLPNGKTVIAHTLSKEELKTIQENERGTNDCWYWTSTPYVDHCAWGVYGSGGFYGNSITYSGGYGGARLGFHKNEIKQLLDIE